MDKAGQTVRCQVLSALGQPCPSLARREAGEVTLTLLEVEVIGCFCRPQPHGVYSVVLISWHWRVIRHRKDNLQKNSIPL